LKESVQLSIAGDVDQIWMNGISPTAMKISVGNGPMYQSQIFFLCLKHATSPVTSDFYSDSDHSPIRLLAQIPNHFFMAAANIAFGIKTCTREWRGDGTDRVTGLWLRREASDGALQI
jgi:hypothetical protein